MRLIYHFLNWDPSFYRVGLCVCVFLFQCDLINTILERAGGRSLETPSVLIDVSSISNHFWLSVFVSVRVVMNDELCILFGCVYGSLPRQLNHPWQSFKDESIIAAAALFTVRPFILSSTHPSFRSTHSPAFNRYFRRRRTYWNQSVSTENWLAWNQCVSEMKPVWKKTVAQEEESAEWENAFVIVSTQTQQTERIHFSNGRSISFYRLDAAGRLRVPLDQLVVNPTVRTS